MTSAAGKSIRFKARRFDQHKVFEEVATVKNGSVRAVNAGKATIKCSSLLTTGIEIQAVCSVEVYVPMQSLAVENKNMEVMSKDACIFPSNTGCLAQSWFIRMTLQG